jgi:hypothetical protein
MLGQWKTDSFEKKPPQCNLSTTDRTAATLGNSRRMCLVLQFSPNFFFPFFSVKTLYNLLQFTIYFTMPQGVLGVESLHHTTFFQRQCKHGNAVS